MDFTNVKNENTKLDLIRRRLSWFYSIIEKCAEGKIIQSFSIAILLNILWQMRFGVCRNW
jgi:hypothetical protein